jgi:hypothetical protein
MGNDDINRQIMNDPPSEELQHVAHFLKQTEQRLWDLGDKKLKSGLTTSEEYELDMCRGDVRRAKDFLSDKK